MHWALLFISYSIFNLQTRESQFFFSIIFLPRLKHHFIWLKHDNIHYCCVRPKFPMFPMFGELIWRTESGWAESWGELRRAQELEEHLWSQLQSSVDSGQGQSSYLSSLSHTHNTQLWPCDSNTATIVIMRFEQSDSPPGLQACTNILCRQFLHVPNSQY